MAQDVRIKEGTFYLSSKEEKEGWEKQTFQNPQKKDETLTRWHKKVSIDGTIENVEFKDDKFKGKVLSVLFKDKEHGDLYLSLPVYDKGGSVETTDSYFNSFVGALQNIKKGQEVKAFINNRNKDKNDRLYKNIVVLNPDNSLIKSNFEFKDVPRWETKEMENDFGEKEIGWDASPTNKFYISVAREAVKAFSGEQKESTPSSSEKKDKPAAKKTTPAAVTTEKEENDNLPF